MTKDRIVGGYRTILEDRKTVKKVLRNTRTGVFTRQDTGEVVPHGKVCKKGCLIQLEGGGFKIKRQPRGRSYDDWWQESNLDGSFAYNGVTDDF